MRRRALTLGLASAALLAGAASAADAQVRDLSTRRHSTLRTLVVAPEHPRVAAVLLVGGPGVANIPARVTPDWERAGSFLVRNRGRLSARGVYTVLIDAPSPPLRPRHLALQPRARADIGDGRGYPAARPASGVADRDQRRHRLGRERGDLLAVPTLPTGWCSPRRWRGPCQA